MIRAALALACLCAGCGSSTSADLAVTDGAHDAADLARGEDDQSFPVRDFATADHVLPPDFQRTGDLTACFPDAGGVDVLCGGQACRKCLQCPPDFTAICYDQMEPPPLDGGQSCHAYLCDGPEDCMNGFACCVTAGSACVGACAGITACHADCDCPAEAPHCANLGNAPLKICRK